jgi:hypothetical protein
MYKDTFYRQEQFIVSNAVSQDFELHFVAQGYNVCYQRVSVQQSGAAPTYINLFVNQGADLIIVAGLLQLLGNLIVSTLGEFYISGTDRLMVRVVGGTLAAIVTVSLFGYKTSVQDTA